MARTEAVTDSSPDARNPHRRRPFSTWVKKLANFKSSSDSERPRRHIKIKHGGKNNNPYPESGIVNGGRESVADTNSFSVTQSASASNVSLDPPNGICDERNGRPNGGRSVAGTVSTDHEGSTMAPDSHGTASVAGTSRTIGGGLDSRRGGDSTFSSPAPSHGISSTSNNQQSVQFSQPFPPTTSPASAIPAHLTPTGNPTTYVAATANGLLTDNASILTLASSSKRRRRRSMDTDASVRALAPSSVWGGSRESLPLSVLSANVDSGIHGTGSRMAADRNSLYSSTGVPPALSSDRTSYYAKQADAVSVRSGRPGHSRTESVGTLGANVALHSPLAGVKNSEIDEMAEQDDATDDQGPKKNED